MTRLKEKDEEVSEAFVKPRSKLSQVTRRSTFNEILDFTKKSNKNTSDTSEEDY